MPRESERERERERQIEIKTRTSFFSVKGDFLVLRVFFLSSGGPEKTKKKSLAVANAFSLSNHCKREEGERKRNRYGDRGRMRRGEGGRKGQGGG